MRTCERCGRKLRFWNSGKGPVCVTCVTIERQRAESAVAVPVGPVTIANRGVTCSHCGGDQFETHETMLNTRGLTLLKLEFLNSTAATYACIACGHLEMFVRKPPTGC